VCGGQLRHPALGLGGCGGSGWCLLHGLGKVQGEKSMSNSTMQRSSCQELLRELERSSGMTAKNQGQLQMSFGSCLWEGEE